MSIHTCMHVYTCKTSLCMNVELCVELCVGLFSLVAILLYHEEQRVGIASVWQVSCDA